MYICIYLFICTYVYIYIYTSGMPVQVDENVNAVLGDGFSTHPNDTHDSIVSTETETLQHTETHCNTLQHTATHCNTLQHNATHCKSTLRM